MADRRGAGQAGREPGLHRRAPRPRRALLRRGQRVRLRRAPGDVVAGDQGPGRRGGNLNPVQPIGAPRRRPLFGRSPMTSSVEPRRKGVAVLLLVALLAIPWQVLGQGPPPGPAPAASAPTWKPEELEQIVAPVALYPDPLLAQVFMASTYPLEVVGAARWLRENPNVKGAQLDEALKKQTWDDSVKSLVSFPPVLTMMNDKLDWTQKLGDAFLAQQKDVMDAVQRLRAKAQAQGNLKSNKEQTVTTEQVPSAAAPPPPPAGQPGPPPPPATIQETTVIKIEPANPQVVYVPTYNPTVVYGAWPYPAYPPYAYYPPGYAAATFATAAISFGVGMAVGGALWGNCNWGRGDVNVHVNNYNNFTKN